MFKKFTVDTIDKFQNHKYVVYDQELLARIRAQYKQI